MIARLGWTCEAELAMNRAQTCFVVVRCAADEPDGTDGCHVAAGGVGGDVSLLGGGGLCSWALVPEKLTMLRDQIGRAYAVLRYAHVIPSKEALNLLSMLRLGADIGFLPEADRKLMDQLLMEIQPAHLQVQAKKKLEPEARDVLRAEIMRRKLKCLPEPDMVPGRSGRGHDDRTEDPQTVDDDE